MSQQKPFVLFLDAEHVMHLRRKYKVGWRGGLFEALLKEAEIEGLKVSKIPKNDLPAFKDGLEKISEQEYGLGDIAKVVFTPLTISPILVNWPIKVVDGLEFIDSKCIVLVFFFRSGGLLKNLLLGIAAFPNRAEDRDDLFRYFSKLVSGVSVGPLSDKSWRELENYRIDMAARGVKQGVQFDGLLENLWEKLL